MSVYVTSDLHLGHHGIVGFRKGFFKDLAEHDEMIIDAWNNEIGKRDTVYVLGDFIWNNKSLEHISRLSGQINWILGNHDPKITKAVMNEININFCAGVWPYKDGAVFSHVPIHPQELSYRWSYNIHGHIHHRDRCIDDPRYYNANVDVQGIKPVPFDYIMDILKSRNNEESNR